MTRELIEQIFERIQTELPEIKKHGLFNDDFEKQNDGTKSGLKFPALFVSFPEGCSWIPNTSGVQRTEDFIVRFHIGAKFQTDKSVLDIFDLKEKIFRTFHKWQPENGSSFARSTENPDELRGNFYVFEQDYTLNLISSSKFIENERVSVTLAPKITPSLDINPNTIENIRTNK